MKYKKGDRLEIEIDDITAESMNNLKYCNTLGGSIDRFYGNKVIRHTTAPEPIVGYVHSSEYGFHYTGKDSSLPLGQFKIRLEWNPATKEVKAEVVE